MIDPKTKKELSLKAIPTNNSTSESNNTEYQAVNLSHNERVIVEEHERLSPHLIFEIIRRDGLDELHRPTRSLIFSGIIAGIMISFSFFANAVLAALLPASPWTDIIAKWGYTLGFIIVILGRMQLFTENTITTVVPILKPFTWKTLFKCSKLWAIVLGSNLIGTTLAALYLCNAMAIDAPFTIAMTEISNHVLHFSALENLVRGIPSGILIASLVWMIPSARGFSLFLIALVTYFIALGDFTHIVVGSTELAYAVLNGNADLFHYFFIFLIPTGLGNIIGGTGVFTALVYAQIHEELPLVKFHCSDSYCSLAEQTRRESRKKKSRSKVKAQKLINNTKSSTLTTEPKTELVKVEIVEKKQNK